MKKKFGLAAAALVLVLIIVIGGTMAWLTDSTAPVKNTFTTSDIDIELAETKTDFQMIPGYTIEKDPVVTVKANSEKAYVFVKLEESDNFDPYLSYEMASGWISLPENEGIFYRVVDKADTDTELQVLKDDKVTVKETVTRAQMQAASGANQPTLTVTAYACQYSKNGTQNFTPAQAWANVSGNE